MLKSLIEVFVKVFVEGLFGWLSNKKNDDLSDQNASLQGALQTVESSHKQEDTAQEEAQNASENTPDFVATDGGLDFSDVNSRP
jgi:hypothetical protein